MQNKQKTFTRKFGSYCALVEQYHAQNPGAAIQDLPTLEEVRRLSLDDAFWNIGHLTHPNEAWAVDLPTQQGIQAYLDVRGCEEELRRIAREVRQMVQQALLIKGKLAALEELCDTGMENSYHFKLLNFWAHLNAQSHQLGSPDVQMVPNPSHWFNWAA